MAYNDPYFYNRDSSFKNEYDYIYDFSINFDAIWYLETYADVAANATYGSNPYKHYVDFGKNEGRKPSLYDKNPYVPVYGSSVKFKSRLNFFESIDNTLRTLPASENNLVASYSLKFLLNDHQAGNLLKTIEIAGGHKFLKFYDPSLLYKNILGVVIDYQINKTSNNLTEISLVLESNVFSPYFNWRSSAFLNDINAVTKLNSNFTNFSLGLEWQPNKKYSKNDFIYFQTNSENEAFIDSFYFANKDINPTPVFSLNDWTKDFSYEFKEAFNIGNKLDVYTFDYRNSFYQTKKYKDNANSLKNFTLKFQNITDLQCISMLLFLEKKCGYKKFKYKLPFFFKEEKSFISNEWNHVFKYKNCHDLEVSFIEDPCALFEEVSQDIPVLKSSNIPVTADGIINIYPGSNFDINLTFKSYSPIGYTWIKYAGNVETYLVNNKSSYSIQNATLSDAGKYNVLAENSAGIFYLPAFTINLLYSPIITKNLDKVIVNYGDIVNFQIQTETVSASVLAILGATTFQWYRNNVIINGATSSVYSIAATEANDANYHVELRNSYMVTNNIPAIKSSIGTFDFDSFIKINSLTANKTLPSEYGKAISLTVSAFGFSTLTYEWRLNGALISGQTGSSYYIGSLTQNNAGTYSVTVTTSSAKAAAKNKKTQSSSIEILTSTYGTLLANFQDLVYSLGTSVVISAPTLQSDTRYDAVYNWYQNGSLLAGKTEKELRFSMSIGNVGYYRLSIDFVDKTTRYVYNTFNSNYFFVTSNNADPVFIKKPINPFIKRDQASNYILNVINLTSSSTFNPDTLDSKTFYVFNPITSYQWQTQTLPNGTVTNVATTSSYNIKSLQSDSNVILNLTNSASTSANKTAASTISTIVSYPPKILSYTFTKKDTSTVNLLTNPSIVFQYGSDFKELNLNVEVRSPSTIDAIVTYEVVGATDQTKEIRITHYFVNVSQSISLNEFSIELPNLGTEDFEINIKDGWVPTKYIKSFKLKMTDSEGNISETPTVSVSWIPFIINFSVMETGGLGAKLSKIGSLVGVPYKLRAYYIAPPSKYNLNWYFNNTILNGATDKLLSFTNPLKTNTGDYKFRLTNKTNSNEWFESDAANIIFSSINSVSNYAESSLYLNSRFKLESNLESNANSIWRYQWALAPTTIDLNYALTNNDFSQFVNIYGAVRATFEIPAVKGTHIGYYGAKIGISEYGYKQDTIRPFNPFFNGIRSLGFKMAYPITKLSVIFPGNFSQLLWKTPSTNGFEPFPFSDYIVPIIYTTQNSVTIELKAEWSEPSVPVTYMWVQGVGRTNTILGAGNPISITKTPGTEQSPASFVFMAVASTPVGTRSSSLMRILFIKTV